mmetsp:Transcript_32120/g.97119  ORF Transcript_32120/g.97119 Transcript_32120/m.97119 type:complete len:399 (+) Transcript_32120:1578-2774(+)
MVQQADELVFDHLDDLFHAVLRELLDGLLQTVDPRGRRVLHHHVDEPLHLRHHRLDLRGDRVHRAARIGAVLEALRLPQLDRGGDVVGQPARELQGLRPGVNPALRRPLHRPGALRGRPDRQAAGEALQEELVRARLEERPVALLLPAQLVHLEHGDALFRLAGRDRRQRLERHLVHGGLVAEGDRKLHQRRVLQVVRRAGLHQRLRLGHPFRHLLDAAGLVVHIEALGIPVRGVRQHVQYVEGVARVELVHLADHELADARGGHLVRVVLGEAQLDHDVPCERQRQAAVAQPLGHPADLGHVLRTDDGEVLHHGLRDLIPHPRGRDVAASLREPLGVRPQQHGHGPRDRGVVDELRHLGLVKLAVAIGVVLADKFLRQLAVHGRNVVQVRDLMKVLR